jgi:hypothetical protein
MAREQAPHQHFSGFVNFSSTNLPRVLTGAAPLSNTRAARARFCQVLNDQRAARSDAGWTSTMPIG